MRKLSDFNSKEELKWWLKKVLSLTEKATEKELAATYEKIGKDAIDKFYDGYDRKYYSPDWNLYSSYYAVPKAGSASLFTDESKMDEKYKRGMTAKKIFNLTIEQGYHGGAWHNGVPTYRTPYPIFSQWGRPAEKQSVPPDKVIGEKISNYNEKEVYLKYLVKYAKTL